MRYPMQLTIAAAILALPLCAAAETRTWTDNLGRKIQADFIRADNGKVVLLFNGAESIVPITQLSESDQQWLRDHANEVTSAVGLPSDDKPAGTGGDLPGLEAVRPKKLASNRTWTERSGRKVTAKFVRVHQGNVVLTQGNRIKTIAFNQFTDSDQDYIKQLLRQQGEDAIADQLDRLSAQNALAAKTPRPSAGQPQTGRPNTGPPNMGRPTMGGPSFPTMPRPPTSFGPGAAFDRMQQQMEKSRRDMERRTQEMQERARRDQEEAERRRQEANDRREAMRREQEQQQQRDAERQRLEAEQRRRDDEQRQREMQEQLAQNSSQPAYTPPAITPPNIPSAAPPSFTEPSAMPAGPDVIDGYCDECGKDVPASIGAGDHCPHCGIYFEYEEDEDGTVTYADNSSGGSSFRLRRIPIKGIVTLVLIVLGGIAAVGRRILGS